MIEKELSAFLRRHRRVTVLSGAGCSTASGIPDYRDDDGGWKHRRPVQYAEFLGNAAVRQRYWAQSYAGWRRVAAALPNPAHVALAALEKAGRINCLVTQNVDGLHRAAGSRNVIDLHGVLSRIRCLDCGRVSRRSEFQARLAQENPGWRAVTRAIAPDGDARLGDADLSLFRVPDCPECGGLLKPDVVFFGEAVPAGRVRRATVALEEADALLVVGSSLMVYSGFRFARLAGELGKPVAIVNRGRTRADPIATCRFTGDCGTLLAAAVAGITEEPEIHARGVDCNPREY
jgi:NAD-dependent SIR2 family protein deacetylase